MCQLTPRIVIELWNILIASRLYEDTVTYFLFLYIPQYRIDSKETPLDNFQCSAIGWVVKPREY